MFRSLSFNFMHYVQKKLVFNMAPKEYQRIQMKIIDFRIFRPLVIFHENFQKY